MDFQPPKIVIKHFPIHIHPIYTTYFFRSLNITDYRLISRHCPLKNCYVATCTNNQHADTIIKLLHQYPMFNKRLSVEYLRDKQYSYEFSFENQPEKQYPLTSNYLNDMNLSSEYPPSLISLTNLVRILVTNQNLYSQICQLCSEHGIDLAKAEPGYLFVVNDKKGHSEESELDSCDSEKYAKQPEKFKRIRKKHIRINKTSIPSYFSIQKMPACSSILKAKNKELSSSIIINFNEGLKQNESKPNIIDEVSGFGFLKSEKTTIIQTDSSVSCGTICKHLSVDEIFAGQASKSELSENKVFNGSRNAFVSSRLYIKNISKTVTEQDLHNLLGSFGCGDDSFFIQYFTKGKLRGQAFANLPSLDLTQKAFKLLHGFIFHGKPLFIEYARSNQAKPDENSLINK